MKALSPFLSLLPALSYAQDFYLVSTACTQENVPDCFRRVGLDVINICDYEKLNDVLPSSVSTGECSSIYRQPWDRTVFLWGRSNPPFAKTIYLQPCGLDYVLTFNRTGNMEGEYDFFRHEGDRNVLGRCETVDLTVPQCTVPNAGGMAECSSRGAVACYLKEGVKFPNC
jgi:hypothetical protein